MSTLGDRSSICQHAFTALLMASGSASFTTPPLWEDPRRTDLNVSYSFSCRSLCHRIHNRTPLPSGISKILEAKIQSGNMGRDVVGRFIAKLFMSCGKLTKNILTITQSLEEYACV